MQLGKVSLTILLLVTATISLAMNPYNVETLVDTNSITTATNSNFNANYLVKSLESDYSSVIKQKNTLATQDRSGQWYLGIDLSVFTSSKNSNESNSGWWNGVIGYNFSKYLGLQYSQLVTYDGMSGGIAEGIINLANNSIFTPYIAGGAGWANLAGDATGAWNVGGGIKFELSKNFQANFDYRYLQTIAARQENKSIQQANAMASISMLGIGITWLFGENKINSTANIQDDGAKTISDITSIIAKSNYTLPKGIKRCENNFSLTKNSATCYKVSSSDITIYLNAKFDYDSSNLNNKGKEVIASFVNFIKDKDINSITNSITIKGYASQGQVGNNFDAYNKRLSQSRAEAVANYMKQLGLTDKKITTKGFGYHNTLNGVDRSDAINQRVQASVSISLKAKPKQ